MEHKTKPEKEHYLIPTDAGDMLRVYDYIYELEAYCVYLEEKMKQSTDNWVAGAKWQQERMYSEEDMISFATFYETHQGKTFEYWGKDLFEVWKQQKQQDL